MISIYIDGACGPERVGIGIVIRGEGYEYTISENIPGEASNNEAGYKALNKALCRLVVNKLTDREIVIHSDSGMLVEQMRGDRMANRGRYYKEYLSAIDTTERFSNLKFKWIPREMNTEANRLANKAW